MSNEEIQRTMEFILENQARFAARTEKDEERLARLEAAFVTLVELARSADERMDSVDAKMGSLDQQGAAFKQQLAALNLSLAEAQARLTEAQAHTDERLNALIAVVERTFGKGGVN